ncbi:hypothetical protein [Lacticaseibacillus mingshuiensis]|uniref:Uncharacterized protein n=1 Tax=Lacticaseibacillus mingshuiensis TaxID=2799574 RepID=A0ABW4CLB5_9LACO|nr:hypothetical protein [Lacticaseibacillus mingshuiensis]
MEATREELKAAFKDLLNDQDFRREMRSELSPTGGFNPEAKAFKDDVKSELRIIYAAKYTDGSTGAYRLVEGFNSIARFILGLRSMAGLTDEQVPEARKLFEQYKQLLKGVSL